MSALDIHLTAEDVEKILAKHVLGSSLAVSTLEEIKEYGYSATPGSKIYIADLNSSANVGKKTTTASCFLTISKPALPEAPAEGHSDYTPNTLPVINDLLSKIRSNTGIPISDSILDTSHDIIPFDYLLSPPTPFSSADIITLREAKEQGRIDESHKILIDLQVGQFLAQMHGKVQNDWFGLPTLKEPTDPSYNWQESFTLLFETVLDGLKAKGYEGYPYEDVRGYMSRAIAFFLFDDVEVPSLVWFTGSDADIYVSLPTHPSTKTPGIVAILPSMPRMLWGDPLMESFFLSSESSKAVLEGYLGGGGSPLISLPRHKTKRLWYTLFLASSLLYECLLPEGGQIPEERRKWAKYTIQSCVELLKEAPCN